MSVMPSFEELGLSGPVLRAVTRAGYDEPTQIQAQAIPEALQGKDIVGASQTGTGKTAAFSLPIVGKMGPSTKPQCLVLEPTRELAAQVEDQMNLFSYYKPLNVMLLHGGVGYGHQIEALENKPDVIILKSISHLTMKGILKKEINSAPWFSPILSTVAKEKFKCFKT